MCVCVCVVRERERGGGGGGERGVGGRGGRRPQFLAAYRCRTKFSSYTLLLPLGAPPVRVVCVCVCACARVVFPYSFSCDNV